MVTGEGSILDHKINGWWHEGESMVDELHNGCAILIDSCMITGGFMEIRHQQVAFGTKKMLAIKQHEDLSTLTWLAPCSSGAFEQQAKFKAVVHGRRMTDSTLLMDACGCALYDANAYSCLLMPMDAYQCSLMLVDAYECLSVLIDAYWCLWMLTNAYSCLLMLLDAYQCLFIRIDAYRCR